jgi:hypothetical protein
MSDIAKAHGREPLSLACELVGRFQYHFSRIERALDVGIARVLDLNEGAALIVCANMDIKKKIDTVQSVVRLQFEDKDKSIEKLLKKITGSTTRTGKMLFTLRSSRMALTASNSRGS